MRRNGLNKASVKYGFVPQYFSVVRKVNPEKYDAIFSNGVDAFIKEKRDLIKKIERIHDELVRKRQLLKFARAMVRGGLYKHEWSAMKLLMVRNSRVSDRVIIGKQLSVWEKMEKVQHLFEKWEKT